MEQPACQHKGGLNDRHFHVHREPFVFPQEGLRSQSIAHFSNRLAETNRFETHPLHSNPTPDCPDSRPSLSRNRFAQPVTSVKILLLKQIELTLPFPNPKQVAATNSDLQDLKQPESDKPIAIGCVDPPSFAS